MSTQQGRGPGGRLTVIATVALPPILLSLLAFPAAPHAATEPAPTAGPPADPVPVDLRLRAAVLVDGFGRIEGWYRDEVAPVEAILRPFHEDSLWVRRISVALAREAAVTGLDGRALASVLLVENPWLDPKAESFVGAVGLMQVMPFHAGAWGCDSDDLRNVESNICHGARIFARYLERHQGDVDRALLAYNGCVRGTNTPDCHLYPDHVYSRAGRAAMRRWLALR